MTRYAILITVLLLAPDPAIGVLTYCGQQKLGCTVCMSVVRDRTVKYKIAKKILSKDQKAVYADISINKKAFTQAELVRLACQLDQDFAGYENIVVAIFDDYKSAQKYVAPWEQEKPVGWQEHEKSLRAYYIRNKTKDEHWVAWYSDPIAKKNRTEIRLCLND